MSLPERHVRIVLLDSADSAFTHRNSTERYERTYPRVAVVLEPCALSKSWREHWRWFRDGTVAYV